MTDEKKAWICTGNLTVEEIAFARAANKMRVDDHDMGWVDPDWLAEHRKRLGTAAPRPSNDQCVVQCSWIDACTGRRCVLHQGHAATGVQGGHDVYGLDTSDLTPEQEIDRLVAAKMPGLDPEHCATCRAFVERNAPPKPPVEVKNELWDAAILKVRQLEAEIKKSGASDREKSNMLHTHSKLWMFATDAWEQEVIRPAQKRAPRVDYPTVTELLDVLRRIAKYSTDPLVAADAATAVRQVESRSDSVTTPEKK